MIFLIAVCFSVMVGLWANSFMAFLAVLVGCIWLHDMLLDIKGE